jgi:hypothetical protein
MCQEANIRALLIDALASRLICSQLALVKPRWPIAHWRERAISSCVPNPRSPQLFKGAP